MTREEMEKAFKKIETTLGLEGFKALENPLYNALKARVLAGEITPAQARLEIIEKCTVQDVLCRDVA